MLRSVRFNGLNKRTVFVDPLQVQFLEDHEIDGRIACNIHFTTGRWITVAHTAAEVNALLTDKDSNRQEEEKAEVTRFRDRARARVQFQKEIDEALRQAQEEGIEIPKATSTRSEKMPDGSIIMTLTYDAESVTNKEKIFEKVFGNTGKKE